MEITGQTYQELKSLVFSIGIKCYLLVKDLPLIENADLRYTEAFGLPMGPGECKYYAKSNEQITQKVHGES